MNSKLGKKIGAGVIVLLITVCLIPSMAGAAAHSDQRQDKDFGMKGQHRPALGIWRNPQMIQKLELTESQVKQIKDADFTFREKRLVSKAQLDGFQLQLDKAFSDDMVDVTTVLEMAQKFSDVKGKLFIQDVESRLALGKLLNANQIKKLNLYDMHQKKQGPRQDQKHTSGCQAIERCDNKKHFKN